MTLFDCLSLEILITVFLIVIITTFLSANYGLSKLPPGPFRWPLTGNIGHMLTGAPPIVFRRLRQRYGDVFSLQLGKRLYVILNGYDTLQEALVNQADDFSDRPDMYSLRISSKGKGVVACSGYPSLPLRGVCERPVNDLQNGARFVQKELRILVQEFGETWGTPFNISQNIFTHLMHIICGIISGRSYPPGDEEFKNFIDSVNVNIGLLKITGILDLFPCLKYMPGDVFKANKYLESVQKSRRFCQALIDDCKKKPMETKSVIGAFLEKQRQCGKNQADPFTDDQLLSTVNGMFGAGVLAARSNILWAVIYLVRDKSLQGRLRNEIIKVVGKVRFPSWNDQKDLPLCQSFVHEVLRHANVTHFATPHGATRDITFRGYTIPKDTIIMPNLDSVMQDPDIFQNPEEFLPDRFIGLDGEFAPNEKQITFCIGRRKCLGATLAPRLVFVIITTLIQRFELLAEDSKRPPPLKGNSGFTNDPPSFKIRTRKVL